MTTTDPLAALAEGTRLARERLSAVMADLPTADEMAAPIITTFHRLHFIEMSEGVMSDAVLLAERGGLDGDVERLVRTIEDLANLVGASVSSCMAGGDSGDRLGNQMRQIVHAISGVDDLRHAYYANRSYDLNGTGPNSTD